MGQKTNPNIFRLSLDKNTWSNKHIEKSYEDSSYMLYQNIEIKKFIIRYFFIHGLHVHNCFINRSSKFLNICITYITTSKSSSIILENCFSKISYLNLIKTCVNNKLINKKRFSLIRKKKLIIRKKKFRKKYKKKKTVFGYNLNKSVKKTSLITKNFISKLLSILKSYINNSHNISIYIQNLNKGLSSRLNISESPLFRKIIFDLRFYKNTPFFKDFINILTIILKKKKSSYILSHYVSTYLSSIKRHNFFLTFLKRAFNIIIFSKLSKLQGLRIVIKGRFNGVSRAKKKIIDIGKTPSQTISTNIDYTCETSYTSNGTFGVKVMLSEKKC